MSRRWRHFPRGSFTAERHKHDRWRYVRSRKAGGMPNGPETLIFAYEIKMWAILVLPRRKGQRFKVPASHQISVEARVAR